MDKEFEGKNRLIGWSECGNDSADRGRKPHGRENTCD